MAETHAGRKKRAAGTVMVTLFLAVLFGGGAAQEQTHEHKDWVAVCDNVRTCTAIGFTPEDHEGLWYAGLYVERDAEAEAAPRVSLILQGDERKPARLRLSVDGVRLPMTADAADGVMATLGPGEGRQLLDAVLKGSVLEVSEGGAVISTVSLAGATAALRWMDDQQKRAGGVTALVARGAKAASTVPAPPPLPVVRASSPTPQTNLPKAPASLERRVRECREMQGLQREMRVHRLAADVYLWLIPCGDGAYNMVDAVAVTDGKGALLDAARGALDEELINADYVAEEQTVMQYAKGRGLGDCGSTAEWAWTGQRFEKVSEEFMPACRGMVEWPVIYRANLIRGRP